MTQGQVKIAGQYDLVFEGDNRQRVALIVLCKKSSLAGLIEKQLGLTFSGEVKGDMHRKKPVSHITVYGKPGSEEEVKKVFDILTGFYDDGIHFSKELVEDILNQLAVKGSYSRQFSKVAANQNKKAGVVRFEPKTKAQAELYETIGENDITFATGPAGTGKTHVAMMKAIEELKAGNVKKIILSRPAQEAGEKLGHLPGDMKEKIDPYMRPLYDELDRAFGNGAYKKMIDNGTIELCPIGFLRGRTLSEAFIVVDEAQNCNRAQMKMVLTRFGEGSKMVVTGDTRQIDLPNKEASGLQPAVERLKGRDGIGCIEFSAADIVRHKVVQTVVEGLGEDFDAQPEQNARPRRFNAPQR